MTLYEKGESIYKLALELEKQRKELIKSNKEPCKYCMKNCLECDVLLAQTIYMEIVAYQATIVNRLYYGLLLMIKACLDEKSMSMRKGNVHNWLDHKNVLINLYPKKLLEINKLSIAMSELSNFRKNIDYTDRPQTQNLLIKAINRANHIYKLVINIFT